MGQQPEIDCTTTGDVICTDCLEGSYNLRDSPSFHNYLTRWVVCPQAVRLSVTLSSNSSEGQCSIRFTYDNTLDEYLRT